MCFWLGNCIPGSCGSLDSIIIIKKQSSLDSLNLGLRLAKNKAKWKENKQTKTANKKADVN